MSQPRTGGSRTSLLAAVVVIVLIGATFGYYYATASSNISSLNGQVSSLNGQVTSLNGRLSTLNLNIVSLTSEAGSLSSEISSQSSEISSQSSQISSLSEQASSASSQIASLSSVAYLNVETSLVNDQNYSMPFNSTTTVASFSVNTGGYLQISGTSSTYIVLYVCYGSTSQSQCGAGAAGVRIVNFGYGGMIFNVPLMPGPVWIDAYVYSAGTATLTVNEWT